MMQTILETKNLSKSFTLHNQGHVSYSVLENINLQVDAGECIVLHGASGLGKSTLLRCLYANYLSQSDAIILRDGDEEYHLDKLSQRALIKLRNEKIAYVSQFLRVIPRVPTLEIVMQPMLNRGFSRSDSETRALELLRRLNIPERLWHLSPTTFSGGEQQRVNIAREFTLFRPLMLLDEPTASLDAANRSTVLDLILEAKGSGSAIIGTFHDVKSREIVADRVFDLSTGAYYV